MVESGWCIGDVMPLSVACRMERVIDIRSRPRRESFGEYGPLRRESRSLVSPRGRKCRASRRPESTRPHRGVQLTSFSPLVRQGLPVPTGSLCVGAGRPARSAGLAPRPFSCSSRLPSQRREVGSYGRTSPPRYPTFPAITPPLASPFPRSSRVPPGPSGRYAPFFLGWPSP